MAKEIYFIRHGESLDNVAGVTFDQMDVNEEGFLDNPLSDLGVRQAEAVAQWLAARVHIDAVYASGLARSNLTAKPISEHYGKPIVELPELREVLVEGGTLKNLELENTISRAIYKIPHGKEIRDRAMDLGVMIAFNTWANFGLKGFESSTDLKARAGYCLDYLASRPERRIAAVAHNFFLGAMMLELIDRDPLNAVLAAPHLGFMPNCSVTCVIARPPKFRIRFAARPTNDFS
ncbi:MAG TPA: histidine phosphatase family protein [bacterium]|nr:histidine phosphatase family protein [bacterium]